MKKHVLFFSILIPTLLFSILLSTSYAQSTQYSGFDVDIDPIAFGLNGFSFHGGYITGSYRFDLGVFGLDIPEWLQFESSFAGAG